MEAVLFQFITRRFVMPSVLHITETDEETNEGAADEESTKFKQRVRIYASDTPVSVEWTDLPLLENGLMSIEDAQQYGIVCAVSEKLRSKKAKALYGYGLTEAQAAVLAPIPATPFNDMQDTIGAQLVKLQQHYPFLHWCVLSDGNYFFYHEKESDADLWSDPFIKKMQEENVVLLPAIYDITPSGTRTIRCPFISFIGPMKTVLFESRYRIGSLVGFYYHPKPGNDAFIVILAEVEFSTVDEDNMMTLMCIDVPKEGAQDVDPLTGEVTVKESKHEPKVVEEQQKRTMEWTRKSLTVVEHERNVTRNSSFDNIVQNEVLPNVRPDMFPEGTIYTETDALKLLQHFNTDFFDAGKEYMKRGNSIENNPAGIGGRTGITVPWLKVNDKIIVPYPTQSEYPADQEV
jgi:hypothetical protein